MANNKGESYSSYDTLYDGGDNNNNDDVLSPVPRNNKDKAHKEGRDQDKVRPNGDGHDIDRDVDQKTMSYHN